MRALILVAGLALWPALPVAQKTPASVAVGRGPEALVSDGMYLWVASLFTNTFS